MRLKTLDVGDILRPPDSALVREKVRPSENADLQIVEVAFQTAQPRYSQAYQLFSNFCQSADCRNFWENFRL